MVTIRVADHASSRVRNSTAPHPSHLAMSTPEMPCDASTDHPGWVHPGRCVVVVMRSRPWSWVARSGVSVAVGLRAVHAELAQVCAPVLLAWHECRAGGGAQGGGAGLCGGIVRCPARGVVVAQAGRDNGRGRRGWRGARGGRRGWSCGRLAVRMHRVGHPIDRPPADLALGGEVGPEVKVLVSDPFRAARVVRSRFRYVLLCARVEDELGVTTLATLSVLVTTSRRPLPAHRWISRCPVGCAFRCSSSRRNPACRARPRTHACRRIPIRPRLPSAPTCRTGRQR